MKKIVSISSLAILTKAAKPEDYFKKLENPGECFKPFFTVGSPASGYPKDSKDFTTQNFEVYMQGSEF
jgi:hypothetical protein